MNDNYLPKDFDPEKFETYTNELCESHAKFMDAEERQVIDNLRQNIKMFENGGVSFTEEVKLGFAIAFAMDEAQNLVHNFRKGLEDPVGTLTTILSLMYKCMLEKLDAEDAVFGDDREEARDD